jgi:hypothetical protein
MSFVSGITAPGPLHDDTIEADSPVTVGPACCCPANPAVRVITPTTGGKPADALLPDVPGLRAPVG